MRKLLPLASHYSLLKLVFTSLAVMLASQSGRLFPNQVYGVVATVYSLAYLLFILAKFGGDSVFARRLSSVEKDWERDRLSSTYLRRSLIRLLFFALCIQAVFLLNDFIFDVPVLYLILISSCLVIANTIRISVSPIFQIGPDFSVFSSVVLILIVSLSIEYYGAMLIWAFGMLLIFVFSRRIRRIFFDAFRIASVDKRPMVSLFYFLSEISYFLLGVGLPLVLAIFFSEEHVGTVRSIQGIVLAGSFFLLILNNQLFNILSRESSSISKSEYLNSYVLASLSFFIAVQFLLYILSINNVIPNIQSEPVIFFVFVFGYSFVAAFGTASGFLNFFGDEKFVFFSTLIGLGILLAAVVLAFFMREGMFVVFGASAGLAATNVFQFLRLWFRHL